MIELKSSEQIEKINEASTIAVNVIKRLKNEAAVGVKTEELDRIADEVIKASGGKSAFLGYHGFPKSICTSINEEIVHGIPSDRVLREGDILSIDVGVEADGYFSDAAITIGIGRIAAQAQRLIEVSQTALYKAIDSTRLGNRVSDISFAIQEHVESCGFSVIREFVGHGIGCCLHEDPQIPCFGQRGMGVRMKEGMVLAIESMVSAGRWEVKILKDGWTAVTKDHSLTAHFEHTVVVDREGPRIFTEGIM